MDVFFVISGFVVTPLILQIFTDSYKGMGERISKLESFYARRVYRLLPALSIIVSVSTLLVLFLGPTYDHSRFALQGIATLLIVGNFGALKYTGDYFSNIPNPLIHTWSLAVEEQIYIALPIVLLILYHKRNLTHKKTISIFVLITVLSMTLTLVPSMSHWFYSTFGFGNKIDQANFYFPISRIWQFSIGSLAFLILKKSPRSNFECHNFWRLIMSFTLVTILFTPHFLKLSQSSLFITLATVLAIVYRSFEFTPKFLSKTLSWLGNRSYSIYLIHLPVLYLAEYSPIFAIGKDENRTIQLLVGALTSLLLGSLCFSRIEIPFRNTGKSITLRSRKFLITVVIMVLVPLSILVVMFEGQKNQYWGLDKSIPQPLYAGYLDPICARDSEMGPACAYPIIGGIKKVLLIGDSHAGQYAEAIVDAAKNQKWSAIVWTHRLCHIQFEKSVEVAVTENCLTVNREMLSWVELNKPDLIIVSQYIHHNSSQKDLRNALSQLHSIVPNILLVENNPIFSQGMEWSTGKPLAIAFKKRIATKSFPEIEMDTQDEAASHQLASWARFQGLKTVNFRKLFCTNGKCVRYLNGDWLYRDADHLSVEGASLTTPIFEDFLKNI